MNENTTNVNYSELSRRGLITAATEYDAANDNAFQEFVNEHDAQVAYERSRIPEDVIAKFDETMPKLAGKGKDLINNMFDGFNKMIDEAVAETAEAAE